MRYSGFVKSTSFRLPEKTLEQIAEIAKTLGMTYTQVLIIAVDRMDKEEKTK